MKLCRRVPSLAGQNPAWSAELPKTLDGNRILRALSSKNAEEQILAYMLADTQKHFPS